jgi:hypothetical protein
LLFFFILDDRFSIVFLHPFADTPHQTAFGRSSEARTGENSRAAPTMFTKEKPAAP